MSEATQQPPRPGNGPVIGQRSVDGDGRSELIKHSLLAGLAGLVPVPVVDDWVAEWVRARMLRNVGERRLVDLEPVAVRRLAAETDAPGWGRAITVAGLAALLARTWRRSFLVLVVARRADEALRTFQLGVLFDHYCASHHVGGAVDGPTAQRIKDAVAQAITTCRSEWVDGALKGAAESSLELLTRASSKTPAVIARWRAVVWQVLGQAVARWRGGTAGAGHQPPSAAAPTADERSPGGAAAASGMEPPLGGATAEEVRAVESDPLLARAARLFEVRLGARGERYLAQLRASFDASFTKAPSSPVAAAGADRGAAGGGAG
jgi:hypothetical protein